MDACVHTHTHTHTQIYIYVPSCPRVFCEALGPVHPSGVCVPLHFAVFVRAPVLVHALS